MLLSKNKINMDTFWWKKCLIKSYALTKCNICTNYLLNHVICLPYSFVSVELRKPDQNDFSRLEEGKQRRGPGDEDEDRRVGYFIAL